MRYDRFNESELELLTAGVDGELSRRETAELRELLANRPEAVALFAELQRDAAGVRDLSKAIAPENLASAILSQLPIIVPSTLKRYTPNRRSAWMPTAIVASVLFTVSSGSYLFFNVQEQRAVAKGIREQLPFVPPNVPADEPDHDSIVVAKAKPGPRPPQISGKPGPETERPFAENLAQTPNVETAPLPRLAGGDLVGAGILDHIKPLIGAEIRLNPIIDAAEFGAMDIQAFLIKELQRDPAFRLDLFSRSPASGLEALQRAAKSAGLAITIDARTQDLLNRKVSVAVALYTEALTPAEIAALLAELAKQLKNTSPVPIGNTHLVPAGAVETREIREIFGVDLNPAKVAKATDPKPLSADTLNKVTSAVKKNDKPAIVSVYLPSQMRTPQAQSKEVKDYLARKADRKPGTVAMLFVVR